MLLNRPKNIDVARFVVEEYIRVNYTINGELIFENIDGVYIVNCDGNVKVKNLKIEKLTEGFVWGIVKGDFSCSWCKNLKTLEGSPKEVGGGVYCSFCTKLESLEGSPEKVGGFFDCSECDNLKTLKGAPKKCKIYCDKRLNREIKFSYKSYIL